MRSMTGYAVEESQNERFALSVELRSVNNRYLDISCNLPGFLAPLESELRAIISQKVVRGRVELSVRLRETSPELMIQVDTVNAERYVEALRKLAELSGIADEIRLSDLLSFEGLFSIEKQRDPEAYKPAVLSALEQALDRLIAGSFQEGRKTGTDIEIQLSRIETGLESITQYAPTLQERIRDQLLTRFRELLGDGMDESRVYAETAVQLVKSSINEELVRMRAHIGSFREAVSEGGAMGKKLDFLCQELNREINTIGSKSFLYEISEAVIEMKDAIENIREQLRNVE